MKNWTTVDATMLYNLCCISIDDLAYDFYTLPDPVLQEKALKNLEDELRNALSLIEDVKRGK